MRVLEAFWRSGDFSSASAWIEHAGAQDAAFIFWGMRAPSPTADVPGPLPNSEPFVHQSSTHPFALTFSELRELLAPFELGSHREEEIVLQLPCADGMPLPTPRLFGIDTPPSERTAALSRFHVPALVVEPLAALDLLTALPEQLPQGLRVGDSLRYWVEATKFLLDLLTRGRFLPTLVRHHEGYIGRWHPMLVDEKDRERRRVFLATMPPSCSIIQPTVTEQQTQSERVFDPFIEGCGDALIRSFQRPETFAEVTRAANNSAKLASSTAWLQSLSGPNAKVSAPAFELLGLEQRFRRWSRKLLQSTDDQGYRVCLQIMTPPEPPAAGQEDGVETLPDQPMWPVEFYLQSTADATQRLSLGVVWRDGANALTPSPLSPEELEVYLLHELGKASSIFAPLRRALEQPFPSGVLLTTREAYDFLHHALAKLKDQGFGVICPDWWRTQTTRVGLHLDVQLQKPSRSSAPSTFGMNQLLDFSWSMVLGDQRMSIEEFRALVKNQAPLVYHGGHWLEIDPLKVAHTIEFLESQGIRKELSVLEALRLGLGVEQSDSLLPVIGFSADGWLSQLVTRSSEIYQSVQQPRGFQGTLRTYQQEGLAWLAFLYHSGVGGCLADDMGLGKTIQLLALLVYEREVHAGERNIGPTLLVVPMSILENWQREAARFAPQLKSLAHHGSDRLAGSAFIQAARNVDLLITTYNLAHRDEHLLSEITWHRIALDEAQSIKNLATKQTQAVRRIIQKQLQQNLTICHRLALTGTPLENRLDELWSIVDFLNPGYLGSISDFRRRFAVPIERYRDRQAQEVLGQLIRPFVLRRLKRDPRIIEDLPEKIEMEERSSLTTEQAALYQAVLENMLPQVDSASGIHRKGLVLATITKLKQICNHPALYLKDKDLRAERSGKLTRLVELLETLIAEGDKMLIFTQYAAMGQILKDFLQDAFNQEVLFLHGALSQPARVKLIDRFQEDGNCQMFVLSLKAGGLGLNLTAANQVIHFDQWWNPAVEQQATDRAYRIGQKRNVQVRKLICKGTLEEKISEMLFSKRELAESIVGATKSVITQMDTDELKRLLELTSTSLFEYSDAQQ